MSIAVEQASALEVGADLAVRNSHRFTGFAIAIAASVTLWAGIGTGIWGLVSLLG